jgi:hypothetical protein
MEKYETPRIQQVIKIIPCSKVSFSPLTYFWWITDISLRETLFFLLEIAPSWHEKKKLGVRITKKRAKNGLFFGPFRYIFCVLARSPLITHDKVT